MIKEKQQHNSGFTLVELMVAMVVSGILLGLVTMAFTTQQGSYLAQEQVSIMQQNLRFATRTIAREVMAAGYDPTGEIQKDSTYPLPVATGTAIQILKDLNADKDFADTGEALYITINLCNELVWDDDTNVAFDAADLTPPEPIADNMEALELYYILQDGTGTLAPTAAQLDTLRAIRITLLARAAIPDRRYKDPATFFTEQIPVVAGTPLSTWGPFTDNIRRRMLTMTVQCRNLEL